MCEQCFKLCNQVRVSLNSFKTHVKNMHIFYYLKRIFILQDVQLALYRTVTNEYPVAVLWNFRSRVTGLIVGLENFTLVSAKANIRITWWINIQGYM